ncbi:hypothetical protein MKX03_000601, partial [Papaver bracteatum]
MVVPKGKTFLLKSIKFSGPCVTENIVVQIAGMIVSPISPKEWGALGRIMNWITFLHVHGLIVEDGGVINGRGEQWWEYSCSNDHFRDRP